MEIDKSKIYHVKTAFECTEKKTVVIDGMEYFTFKGYGSTFGNIDRDDEVMVSGCFRKSLAQMQPAMLWQHQMSEPIGVYDACREDGKGLYMEGRMPLADDFVRGRVVPQMKAGSVRAMSIGFTVNEYTYNKEEDIVYFTDVTLWEVSLVTIPANSQAVVTDIKSFEEAKNITELNKLLKMYDISDKKCNIIISKIKSFVRDEQNKEETERDVRNELKKFLDELKKINWR